MRIFVIIFAALIVALNTGYYVLKGLQPPAPVVQATEAVVAPPTQTEVYVPTVTLAVGTIIRPDHLGRTGLADPSITPEMIIADEAGTAALVGSVARQILPRGVPIARAAVVQPGERGFLAAVLPKGKRAISIPIGETSGISGLVMPGDRVDIILTYSVTGDSIDAVRDIRASETVVSNLRVLALDQRLSPHDSTLEQAANAAQVIPPARNATLEVTPREAEMIALATSLGELALVLNSVRDGGDPDVEADETDAGEPEPPVAGTDRFRLDLPPLSRRPLTLDSDVTSLLQRLSPAAEDDEADAVVLSGPMPLPERRNRVQVVRGMTSSAVEFSAQVSEVAEDIAPPAAD